MFHSFENELRAAAKHMIFEERSGNTEYSHDRRVQALKMTYVHFGRKQLVTGSGQCGANAATDEWDWFYYKNRRDFYVKRVGEKLAEGPTAKEYMSFALDVYNFERKMTKQYISEASFKISQDELLEGNSTTV
jgi:ssDNA-binding replication factor A large subunit